jgi:hypothetical protein
MMLSNSANLLFVFFLTDCFFGSSFGFGSFVNQLLNGACTMTGSSNEKSKSENKAVTGELSVIVNGKQETLRAFQLFDIGGSLVFMFGDASSHTGVVSTRFPKEKLGQELVYIEGDSSVNVSYSVNSEHVAWSGGKIRVATKDDGDYEGTLQAVISAPGSSWNLTGGEFTVNNA